MKTQEAKNEECKSCIYSSPIFEGLSEAELAFLAKTSSQGFYRKSEVIFNENDEIQRFCFLKLGLLKLSKKDEEGKCHIINIAKPNDCVGLLSVFSNLHYNYSLTALEDSLIYYVDLEALKYVISNNGQFGVKMLARISQAADKVINTTFEINNKNLRGRIAYILLDFTENIYKKNIFDSPVSRKEMGQLIGMTTENVIRILSEFRKDGIIEITGKTIKVLKPDFLHTLQRLA
ncbi:MAG TPA: Crp/Fnr family transcriptional regulator [Bacteroidales bacterium]|jgi:CRP-like cAMP-binding protein